MGILWFMTGRLPFNPDRMKTKQTGERAGSGDDQSPQSVLGSGNGSGNKKGNSSGNRSGHKDQPLSVSQLASRIDQTIKRGLSEQFVVVGELSSVSYRTHYYFSVKDDQALINAVMFASAARRSSYKPVQGDSVVLKGRVEYYAPSGRISLIVTSIHPLGEGELERAFKARCEELRERGWFDHDHKQLIPSFPKKIAIVTSKDSAAIADVIDTMNRRCPSIELVIVDVHVQGASAKGMIARAIQRLDRNADSLGIDAIIVTRGGGSMEDLWAFNEMEVIEAVYHAKTPIVAAIGHETDTTIVELVADERCATPTQAAMRLSPDREALEEQVYSMESRLNRSIRSMIQYRNQQLETIERSLPTPSSLIEMQGHRVDRFTDRLHSGIQRDLAQKNQRINQFAMRLARVQPSAIHARREERLHQVGDRLDRVMKRLLERSNNQLNAIERELHAIGPAQVLARGFSITSNPSGKLIRSADEAKKEQELTTTFADGKVRSSVLIEGQNDLDSDPRLRNTKPLKKRTKKRKVQSKDSDPDQPGLFA